jgi:NAD(P)-dependent dehydrogenase (short-subunit alcohol dehydrogenase family)
MKQKIIVVSGASSGFGRLTAQKLHESGHTVIGTSRNPKTEEAFALLPLDVTSDESVSNFVSEVQEQHGRIDVLINNAGRSHNSLLEETTLKDARVIFEVNFWGMVRMNRAVLPLMRKQGNGLVITVSSLAGLVGTPGQGFYGAAKHAIEGYSETLRSELANSPVEVALIEPGFFQTNIKEAMVRNGEPISDYDNVRDIVSQKLDEGFEDGGDPAEVVAAIEKAIANDGKTFRQLVGKDAKTIARLKRWLPESWFLDGTKKQFGL